MLPRQIALIVGVALAGGGITIAHITALAVQLAFFGLATGALAIALAPGTGRRGGSAMRMAASTAPGRKVVFLEANFRIVSRIQKPVVGSYRDGTCACSGAEASVIVSRLTPDQWHTSPNQA